MKLKLILVILMIFAALTSPAQLITLKGRVTDAKTGSPVPGASIISGSFGTSADDQGRFVLYIQQPVIEESGITVSSIGYQTLHLTDITDDYTATLTPIVQELKTVDIKAGAEGIVQKAFRQVPYNYLDNDFNVTGIQRMVHSIRDTFGYQYYYSNTSKVRMYMSAYGVFPVVAQVTLMEKDEKLARNPNAVLTRFLNGYTIPLTHDYVHTGSGLLKGDPDKFKYKLNRKEMIDGRKAYVVNFFSFLKDGDAGILYIDTASYAFVKILFTRYKVQTPKYIDLDKITISVQYKAYADKWALDVVKFNSKTENKGFTIERSDEFHVAAINTEHAAQIPEKAIIKERIIDDRTQPRIEFSSEEKNIPKTVQKTIEGGLPKIRFPQIAGSVHMPLKKDTVTQPPVNK
jgi:hypothetical protein